jgi:hypothetical protein
MIKSLTKVTKILCMHFLQELRFFFGPLILLRLSAIMSVCKWNSLSVHSAVFISLTQAKTSSSLYINRHDFKW